MADFRPISINEVRIAGNIVRDPELKYIGNGTPVCSFSVAVSEKFKTKTGETQEKTAYVDVVCWRALAEYIGERAVKGDPVYVSGSLIQEEWEDRATGQKRTKLKVQAFRIQPQTWTGSNSSGGGRSADRGTAQAPKQRPIEEPIPEDDIPF